MDDKYNPVKQSKMWHHNGCEMETSIPPRMVRSLQGVVIYVMVIILLSILLRINSGFKLSWRI